MKLRALCLIVLLAVTSAGFASSRAYKKAMKLYEKGPAHAPELIEMLNKQLEKHPDDLECRGLLGITLYGIGDLEAALEQFDTVVNTQLSRKGAVLNISSGMMTMKLMTLLQLRRLKAVDDSYHIYWGFMKEQERKDVDHLYRIVYGMELVEKSISIVETDAKFNIHGQIYVVVDKNNVDAIRKDSSGSIYLPNQLPEDPWFLVTGIPENYRLDGSFHFSVLWKDKTAIAVSSATKSAETDEVTREVIKANTKTINIPKTEITSTRRDWQVIQIKTDDGTPVIAYRLVNQ